MESGDDGLESEANVRPRPRLTGAGQPRGCPAARWTAIDRGLSRDPLAQARLNRSAKGAGTGHSPRYPKSGTTQSDRLLGQRYRRVSYASGVFFTLAMHLRLLTNFLFRHFDLPLRPPLHRLPPQMPH